MDPTLLPGPLASFATALGQGVLAAFIYLVPAISIALLLRGLSDPRKEGWEIVPAAALMKAHYVRWSLVARRINHGLIAVYLLHLTAWVALGSEACSATASHLAGAAANLVQVTDAVFLVGFAILIVLAGAAVGWALVYLLRARRAGWPDPRRHDYLVVHLVLIPLALLILWTGFGVTGTMVCRAFGT